MDRQDYVIEVSHVSKSFKDNKVLKFRVTPRQFNCASLGCVMDLLIDEKNGCILALIIPGPGKFCSVLGRDSEYIIPWEQVCQIGRDIILVDIDEKECRKKCE